MAPLQPLGFPESQGWDSITKWAGPGCQAFAWAGALAQARQDPGVLPRPDTCTCSDSTGSHIFPASSSERRVLFFPHKARAGPSSTCLGGAKGVHQIPSHESDFWAGPVTGWVLVRSAFLCIPVLVGPPPSMPSRTLFKLLAGPSQMTALPSCSMSGTSSASALWKPLSCFALCGNLLIGPWVHYLCL